MTHNTLPTVDTTHRFRKTKTRTCGYNPKPYKYVPITISFSVRPKLLLLLLLRGEVSPPRLTQTLDAVVVEPESGERPEAGQVGQAGDDVVGEVGQLQPVARAEPQHRGQPVVAAVQADQVAGREVRRKGGLRG